MLAGLPDYHMPVATSSARDCYSDGWHYYGFWLEIKAHGKKPTKNQFACLAELREQGQFAEWTDKLQAAIILTEKYCQRVYKQRG